MVGGMRKIILGSIGVDDEKNLFRYDIMEKSRQRVIHVSWRTYKWVMEHES